MTFSSYAWFSEVLCFLLQLTVFFKVKNPRSVRALMLILCAGNLVAALTHKIPLLYWDSLWIIRMVALVAFLWAVGDVVSLPEKPNWVLRIPIGAAVYLVIPYWPLHAENGPVEMEMYRFFGLGLALFIVIVHLVFLIPAGRAVNLPLCLMGCLAAETTGSGAVLLFGVLNRFQMLAWWVGIAFLVAYAIRNQGGVHSPARAAQVLTACCGESLDGSLRLPLQYRLPNETQVSSRYSHAVQGRIA